MEVAGLLGQMEEQGSWMLARCPDSSARYSGVERGFIMAGPYRTPALLPRESVPPAAALDDAAEHGRTELDTLDDLEAYASVQASRATSDATLPREAVAALVAILALGWTLVIVCVQLAGAR